MIPETQISDETIVFEDIFPDFLDSWLILEVNVTFK
jgi:hypothetical protein